MQRKAAHPGEDRLFDLAHDLLPASERAACIDHLARCPECEERFRVLARDRERARSAALPARARGGWSARPRHASARPLWLGSAAAVLLLSLAAAALLVAPSAPPEPYWMPVQSEPEQPRAARMPDRYLAAIRAYAERDAPRAIALLESAPIPEDQRYVRLIHASALLNAGRAQDARAELESLGLRALPQPARRRAHWILYQACRRTGDDGAADALLGELVRERGEIGVLAREEALLRSRAR